MSGAFKGFTEKDIEKIKDVQGGNPPEMKSKIISAIKPKQKVQQTRKVEPPDEKAKLYDKPPMNNNNEEPPKDDKNEENGQSEAAILQIDPEETATMKIIDGLKEISLVEKPLDMESFQIHQKLIEEQNRKRKEMLAKALDDRKKQTAEEAMRIDGIKKELESLDVQLSGDVAMLRKQIDKASLSYNDAEKNYHKIELDFLAAKLHLQKERERKELLTEHLCTLIAHNETRKAKKLESLMEQLVYKKEESSSLRDGVCEKTGKMLEMENGQYVLRDDE